MDGSAVAGEDKPRCVVVAVGATGAGKSSLLGCLLTLTGSVHPEDVEAARTAAVQLGRPDLAHAFVADTGRLERRKGMTLNTGTRFLDTPSRTIGLVDCPGASKGLKCLVPGVAQADTVLAVVPADMTCAELCSPRCAIRQHLRVARGLGIGHVIVVVTKMDTTDPPYCQARFEELAKLAADAVVQDVGLDRGEVVCIPASARDSVNIAAASNQTAWFKGWEWRGHRGQSVLDVLDMCCPAPSNAAAAQRPFRLSVLDLFKVAGIGTVVIGRVDAGSIAPNELLALAPCGLASVVRSVERFQVPVDRAFAGDTVGLCIKDLATCDAKRGVVVGSYPHNQPARAASFVAEIHIFGDIGKVSVRKGFSPNVLRTTGSVPCTLSDIVSCPNPDSGLVQPGETAVVRFTPIKPLAMETEAEFGILGRIVLHDGAVLVGFGRVLSVEAAPGEVTLKRSARRLLAKRLSAQGADTDSGAGAAR